MPVASQRDAKLTKTYEVLEPEVDAFIDEVFKMASDAKVLDPALYVGQARRLRAQGRTEEAVKLLNDAIETSIKEGKGTRDLFIDCDLWLAEYYLDEGKGELAEPHIKLCLEHPVVRPAGQMLNGYRLMQKGDFSKAAEELSNALTKLNDHGAAHALFGLCQLRRGMISEGRQHLEQGVRLGHPVPAIQGMAGSPSQRVDITIRPWWLPGSFWSRENMPWWDGRWSDSFGYRRGILKRLPTIFKLPTTGLIMISGRPFNSRRRNSPCRTPRGIRHSA